MPQICRLGDPHSHGGQIITASGDTFVNSIPVARLGDLVSCPIHGPQTIVSAAGLSSVNSRGIARVGDMTSCGATLLPGSPDTFCSN